MTPTSLSPASVADAQFFGDTRAEHTLSLKFLDVTLNFYAFTFG